MKQNWLKYCQSQTTRELLKPGFFFSLRDEESTVPSDEGEDVTEPPALKRQRTLMDFAMNENHWPCFKNSDHSTSLKEYELKYSRDQKEGINYLESVIRNSRVNSKVLLHDSLFFYSKSIPWVSEGNVLLIFTN